MTSAHRSICTTLEPGGRIFATLLIRGPGARDRLCRLFRAAGVRVEQLDDVTAALEARSRERAATARALLQERRTTLRGRLAMLLVVAEEALVRILIARGHVGRWRFLARYP